MEFVVNVLSNILNMPLFLYFVAAFVFESIFYLIYRVIGVKR